MSFWSSFWSNGKKTSIAALKNEYLRVAQSEAILSPPNDVPLSLRCPMSCSLMRDPVITKEGKVYERESILKQIELQHRDPFTTNRLNERDLYSFSALFQPIQTVVTRQKAYLLVKHDLMIKARVLAQSRSFNELPALFICQISGKMMNEPLLCMSNGKVYEKEIIEAYLTKHNHVDESGEAHSLDDYEFFSEFAEQIKLYIFYSEQHDIALMQIRPRAV